MARRPTKTLVTLSVVVVVAAAAGCAVSVHRDVAPAPDVAFECPTESEQYPRASSPWQDGRLPADFVATEVLTCTEEWDAATGVVIESRAAASDQLLAALALPDRVNDFAACPAVAESPPFILLSDGTTSHRPRLPLDECHFTRAEVTDALQEAGLVETRRTPASR